MTDIYPVILAGGTGSRLWPLSRQNLPKQFIDPLEQGVSLLQATINRSRSCSSLPPTIIASLNHRFVLAHQIAEVDLDSKHVFLESEPKNTASSVLIAALHITSKSEGATLLILPSDQYISDDILFSQQVSELSQSLDEESVLLFGVQPAWANTQYGYLKIGSQKYSPLPDGSRKLERFAEKPSQEIADIFVSSGDYLWNSGMVLASASLIIELFKKHQPVLFETISESFHSRQQLFEFSVVDLKEAESISFDCAILELMQVNTEVGVLSVDWDDIGTWRNLVSRRKMLGIESMCFGEGKTKLMLTRDELVLIEDDDLVMVADINVLSDMGAITTHLASTNQLSLLNSIDTYRPWGSFKVLAQGDGFLVKQLSVNSGCQISLQSHEQRVENWVVVSGRASVQLNTSKFELSAGESLRIGINQVHRLSNNSGGLLKLIEVQTGLILDEGDIVRYDDEYLRHLKT